MSFDQPDESAGCGDVPGGAVINNQTLDVKFRLHLRRGSLIYSDHHKIEYCTGKWDDIYSYDVGADKNHVLVNLSEDAKAEPFIAHVSCVQWSCELCGDRLAEDIKIMDRKVVVPAKCPDPECESNLSAEELAELARSNT